MKKIHKLLYSCFSFVLTLAYRNGAGAGIVCTEVSSTISSYCGSADASANYYVFARAAYDAIQEQTVCSEIVEKQLCPAGYYVAKCYSDPNKTIECAESEWETCCSYYRTVCSSCLTPGTVDASVEQACANFSRSYTFDLCSEQSITANGNIKGDAAGTNYRRRYTCSRSYYEAAAVGSIYRESDCVVPSATEITEDSGAIYEYVNSCYYTGTN